MRRAIADADVGDDVLDGDPTVARLQDRVCELLGTERALFFPTGTMANQAALWLLGTSRHRDPARRRGAHHPLGVRRRRGALRPAGAAGTRLGSGRWTPRRSGRRSARPRRTRRGPAWSAFENTHNGAGGKVTPLDELRAMRQVAREHRLPVHMDGARLWNAAAATGTPLADFAACADTVMVSFSKGLGAPVGAALAGTSDAMADAWAVRKRLGGGMRQVGHPGGRGAVRTGAPSRAAAGRSRARPHPGGAGGWRGRSARGAARHEHRHDRPALRRHVRATWCGRPRSRACWCPSGRRRDCGPSRTWTSGGRRWRRRASALAAILERSG